MLIIQVTILFEMDYPAPPASETHVFYKGKWREYLKMSDRQQYLHRKERYVGFVIVVLGSLYAELKMKYRVATIGSASPYLIESATD